MIAIWFCRSCGARTLLSMPRCCMCYRPRISWPTDIYEPHAAERAHRDVTDPHPRRPGEGNS